MGIVTKAVAILHDVQKDKESCALREGFCSHECAIATPSSVKTLKRVARGELT
jgi:hypothetical protein